MVETTPDMYKLNTMNRHGYYYLERLLLACICVEKFTYLTNTVRETLVPFSDDTRTALLTHVHGHTDKGWLRILQ